LFTHLLKQTLELLVRDLSADLALSTHAHQQLLDLVRELRAREGYPRHWG
jgi:hypothetical protein